MELIERRKRIDFEQTVGLSLNMLPGIDPHSWIALNCLKSPRITRCSNDISMSQNILQTSKMQSTLLVQLPIRAIITQQSSDSCASTNSTPQREVFIHLAQALNSSSKPQFRSRISLRSPFLSSVISPLKRSLHSSLLTKLLCPELSLHHGHLERLQPAV
jgi:hypothetical protein